MTTMTMRNVRILITCTTTSLTGPWSKPPLLPLHLHLDGMLLCQIAGAYSRFNKWWQSLAEFHLIRKWLDSLCLSLQYYYYTTLTLTTTAMTPTTANHESDGEMSEIDELGSQVVFQRTKSATETLRNRHDIASLLPKFQDMVPGSLREAAAVENVFKLK